MGLLGLRLRWVSKKSEDLIMVVLPTTLSRGRERRKNFEIVTPRLRKLKEIIQRHTDTEEDRMTTKRKIKGVC